MFSARPLDQGFAATAKTTFPSDQGLDLTEDIEGFGGSAILLESLPVYYSLAHRYGLQWS